MTPPGFLRLAGALIDRVDRPQSGLFAITMSAGGARHVLIVAVGPPRRFPSWAIARERPRGDAADAEVRGLREKLEGARIVRAWATRNELVLEVSRGEVVWWVSAGTRFSVAPPLENVVPEGEEPPPLALDSGAGEALLLEQETRLADAARTSAITTLRKLHERLARRVLAIDGDGTEVARAEERATTAALFVAAAAKARPGVAELEAVDWSSGEATIVKLAIDPAKSPREQLGAIFARAKRLRAGVRVAMARRDEAELAQLLISDAITALAVPKTPAEVQKLLASLARELPGDVRIPQPKTPPGSKKKPAASSPVRRFLTRSGAPILVGKDAKGNDELTVKMAKPGDLWLHVKGATGAHVVVPSWYRTPNGDPDALLDAATLAAHFSDERGESLVDVSYADRRYVRKRRGSAAGSVEVTSEKVVLVRREEARLTRLLASEDRDAAPVPITKP